MFENAYEFIGYAAVAYFPHVLLFFTVVRNLYYAELFYIAGNGCLRGVKTRFFKHTG